MTIREENLEAAPPWQALVELTGYAGEVLRADAAVSVADGDGQATCAYRLIGRGRPVGRLHTLNPSYAARLLRID